MYSFHVCAVSLCDGLLLTFIVPFIVANPGMEWEYFELLPHRDIRFIDYGANEFELVMLVCYANT